MDLKPVVDGLTKEYAGRYDIRVVNLSKADEGMQRLADELKVQYVPTFVFVHSDGKIGNTVVGSMTGDAIVAELGKLQ